MRCLDEVKHPNGVRTVARRWARSRRVWAAGDLIVALLAVGAVAYARHRAGVRWAREEALPRMRVLIEAGPTERGGLNYLAAYRLAEQAERRLPHDPTLEMLLRSVSTKPTVLTEPSGASVWVKPYLEPEAPWQRIGETPLRDVRLPVTEMRWRVEKTGFASILRVGSPGKVDSKRGTFAPETYSIKLVPAGSQPADMVRVDGTEEVPEFLVDQREVTNRQFKIFVDAGGYRDRRYWKHEFRRDGRVLSWTEAMQGFVDRTGRPGPSTSEAGDFPEGKADFPVGGVSWYEAAALPSSPGRACRRSSTGGPPRGSVGVIRISSP